MLVLRNTVGTLAVVCLIMVWLGSSVSAQALKIGYVKDERIYSEFKDWQKAQEDWEVERKAWEEEATTMQQDLTDMINEYEKQKLILSDEKKRERETAIAAKEEALDAYTRQVFGPNGTAERKQAELIQPLLERIHRAIETLAVEGNYDVIFTLQGIGYIKESYDVTDKVLELLDEIE